VHVGPFTPRTLGLHPTQVYETISMLLLTAFLLAFYPFRRHDGQVFTLFVALYAIHRFLNETLRNDTETVGIPQLHMSLSQNISILMLLFALALEIGLRKYGTKQPQGPAAVTGPSPPA
jgi:phosphatidylglycerol:prolipoprotein diacylglycerol transferase